MAKRIYRSRSNKVIAGVCGGLAEYFGIDRVLIRIVWVVTVICAGTGILAYILAWILIPKEPEVHMVNS
jgi:phage shock protein C